MLKDGFNYDDTDLIQSWNHGSGWLWPGLATATSCQDSPTRAETTLGKAARIYSRGKEPAQKEVHKSGTPVHRATCVRTPHRPRPLPLLPPTDSDASISVTPKQVAGRSVESLVGNCPATVKPQSHRFSGDDHRGYAKTLPVGSEKRQLNIPATGNWRFSWKKRPASTISQNEASIPASTPRSPETEASLRSESKAASPSSPFQQNSKKPFSPKALSPRAPIPKGLLGDITKSKCPSIKQTARPDPLLPSILDSLSSSSEVVENPSPLPQQESGKHLPKPGLQTSSAKEVKEAAEEDTGVGKHCPWSIFCGDQKRPPAKHQPPLKDGSFIVIDDINSTLRAKTNQKAGQKSSFPAWLEQHNSKKVQPNVYVEPIKETLAQLSDLRAAFQVSNDPKKPNTRIVSMWELHRLAREKLIGIDDLLVVKEIFDTIDSDRSGLLNKKEFIQAIALLVSEHLPTQDAAEDRVNDLIGQEVWQKIDRDGSGEIDFLEFLEWYTSNGFKTEMLLSSEELRIRKLAQTHNVLVQDVDRIKKCFDMWDKDGSGDIELSEFGSLIGVALKLPTGVELPPSRIRFLMAQLDADKSGSADFEEFLSWWIKYFGVGVTEEGSGTGKSTKIAFEDFYRIRKMTQLDPPASIWLDLEDLHTSRRKAISDSDQAKATVEALTEGGPQSLLKILREFDTV
eukprot:TRINITY_DN7176_c0_g1_i1.p1 TRINITY_DN7176_c0_g1~~TRINITY_DN7176_c0_g1_i1.p1  ORF type:complete len:682 (+),score=112.50 TRINITY_DN7176_c0_g1_i1:166-2211(+)